MVSIDEESWSIISGESGRFSDKFSSFEFIAAPDLLSDDVSDAFTIISKAPSVYSVVSGQLESVDFSVFPDEFSGGQKDDKNKTFKQLPKKLHYGYRGRKSRFRYPSKNPILQSLPEDEVSMKYSLSEVQQMCSQVYDQYENKIELLNALCTQTLFSTFDFGEVETTKVTELKTGLMHQIINEMFPPSCARLLWISYEEKTRKLWLQDAEMSKKIRENLRVTPDVQNNFLRIIQSKHEWNLLKKPWLRAVEVADRIREKKECEDIENECEEIQTIVNSFF